MITLSKLVNLMEILQVYADLYAQKVFHLGVSINLLTNQTSTTSIWNDDEHRARLAVEIEEMGEMCVKGELPVTKVLVDHLLTCFNTFETGANNSDPTKKASAIAIAQSMHNGLLAHNLSTLRKRLIHELSTKLFFQVLHSRKLLFEKPREKWEQVIERFPDAAQDVEEAAKGFALSR